MSLPLTLVKSPSKISWAIPHVEVVSICVLELSLWLRGGVGEDSLGKCGGWQVCIGSWEWSEHHQGKLGQLCDGGEKAQAKHRCLCMPR